MALSGRVWRGCLLLLVAGLVYSMFLLPRHESDYRPNDAVEQGIFHPPDDAVEHGMLKETVQDAPVLAEEQSWTEEVSEPDEPDESVQEKSSMCDIYPDTGNIVVAIKTGATEVMEKLPPLLETSLNCLQSPLIFSDLEQTLGDKQIHDVLSRLSTAYKDTNPDFKPYWRQQELQSQGRDNEVDPIAQAVLDKYKFVPAVEMAYELQPDKEWYVFLNADTYLSWPNLKRYLATLDPKRKLYIGKSFKKDDDTEPYFSAQEGAGFVLSGAAAREFAVGHESITTKLEQNLKDWYPGEFMIADALYNEIDLRLTDGSPMFNEMNTVSIPGGQDDAWCQPALTLHGMSPDEMRRVYKQEEAHDFSRFLLRDVFTTAYPNNHIPFWRENWDNKAQDGMFSLKVGPVTKTNSQGAEKTIDPNKSLVDCETACELTEDCFQYLWLKTTISRGDDPPGKANACFLSRVFRLGGSRAPQEANNEHERGTSRRWYSGWRRDKVADWMKSNSECPLKSNDAWPTLGGPN